MTYRADGDDAMTPSRHGCPIPPASSGRPR